MAPANLARIRQGGLWQAPWENLLLPGLRYVFETEVHAYAFSIAANALLSFFPFNLIMLAICHRWLHWDNAYQTILQLLRVNLPYGADFVIRNLQVVVFGRPRLQIISVLMLFFTSSGVFLPLEVALNKVWGIQRNRSFLKNQGMAFLLAMACGALALGFIMAITPVRTAIGFLIGWLPSRSLPGLVSRVALEMASVSLIASIYFMIYYFLPNGKVPVARVFPAAIIAGILTEVGKAIYFLTLPMFRFREVYGPFETSVTLLFWAYLGALILLFGAHLSARRFAPGRALTAEPETELAECSVQPASMER